MVAKPEERVAAQMAQSRRGAVNRGGATIQFQDSSARMKFGKFTNTQLVFSVHQMIPRSFRASPLIALPVPRLAFVIS